MLINSKIKYQQQTQQKFQQVKTRNYNEKMKIILIIKQLSLVEAIHAVEQQTNTHTHSTETNEHTN